MKVALVNTNLIKPPIAPIGLDYVAESLTAAGHEPVLLDLAWAADPVGEVEEFFSRTDVGLVGVTVRNTDDCAATTRHSFLPKIAAITSAIRSSSPAPIILGGVGFSVMPETVLELSGADGGVWGEGEFVLPELASRLEHHQPWTDLPNIVTSAAPRASSNAVHFPDLATLPAMQRRFVDNPRYFTEGGQAGFETKRGCPMGCTYCADPVAKGTTMRCRPAPAVADELEALLAQGIDALHACDSEFNIPEAHARQVCEELVRRGLGDRVRWYAYCSPAPFSKTTAQLLRRAGCVGINFGVDHGDPEMLRRLGRFYGPDDVLAAARWSRQAGMVVMFDLLLGAPGESRSSITSAIDLARRADPEQIGISLGVRVWPGTPLAAEVATTPPPAGLSGGPTPDHPRFFLEPSVAEGAADLIDQLVANDRRFLFFNPAQEGQNYNYNDNHVLVEAIAQGARGAYWDILRRRTLQQEERVP